MKKSTISVMMSCFFHLCGRGIVPCQLSFSSCSNALYQGRLTFLWWYRWAWVAWFSRGLMLGSGLSPCRVELQQSRPSRKIKAAHKGQLYIQFLPSSKGRRRKKRRTIKARLVEGFS